MKNNNNKPRVYRLSISKQKGEKKINVPEVHLITSAGIEGDAHFGTFKAVSLLPFESITKFAGRGLNVSPGDFAENITTIGLDFDSITVGTKLALGNSAIIEIVQIGKECHDNCSIGLAAGDCIMPREGIFARVLKGGKLFQGDKIHVFK